MKPLLALAIVSAGLCLSGCVGYDSYPPVAGDTARNNPNSPPLDEIMIAGMQWLITRYPPVGHEGNVAINLPRGVRPEHYVRIVQTIGGRAVPLCESNANLPVYHVKSIRVRAGTAQIDVLRPALEAGPTPAGTPVSQGFTLDLRGGWEEWRVTRWREWSVGTIEAPPLNPVPEPLPEWKPPSLRDDN